MKKLLALEEVHKVKSSNIDRIGYDNEDAYVIFSNGNVYKYPNVPREIFDTLLTAESVGKQFSKTLKQLNKYEKLEDTVIVPNESGVIAEEETMVVTVEYKGQKYSSTRKVTKAALNLNPDKYDLLSSMAVDGVKLCVRQAIDNSN